MTQVHEASMTPTIDSNDKVLPSGYQVDIANIIKNSNYSSIPTTITEDTVSTMETGDFETISTYKPIRNHNNMAIDDFYQSLIKQSNSLSVSTFRNDLYQHQERSRAESQRQPQQPVIVNQILPGEEGRFLSSFLKQPYGIPNQGIVENTTLAEIELAAAAASTSSNGNHLNIVNHQYMNNINGMMLPNQISGIPEPQGITNNAYQNTTLDEKQIRTKTDENNDQVYMSLKEGELSKVTNSSNPLVFMVIEIDGNPVGTIAIELFKNIVPKTAENFRQLCTLEHGFGYHMSYFHRVIPGFVCQGGDFEKSDGTGGFSIYGGEFEDENFQLTHNRPFLLSMANCGKNTNGSQFFITMIPCPHLDGKHVVFGQVIKGLKVIKEIEKCGTESGEITREIKIISCGQIE
ncbi:hypothetical protein GJ496_003953 [Pomphorhynchus laevis]|nr:hypothetical protein GJ496_003953 [Pomphorhynchus laevis]